ncbi:MAG: bifunctional adenosylcobinamide kinase/adenosylcobinamide-phosphate guanylyltransferase [Pseudomonadota bacterium]
MITFILGGARCGKSRHAEALANRWLDAHPDGERIYIATAQVFDDEMRDRVAQHQDQRGGNWRTIEEPMALRDVLQKEADQNRFILVDCLTLWLTNCLLAEHDCNGAVTGLCEALTALDGEIVIVSNEVGLGIVPENKLARQFRDIAGIANQRVAEVADKVVFIAAGLPVVLKENGSEG